MEIELQQNLITVHRSKNLSFKFPLIIFNEENGEKNGSYNKKKNLKYSFNHK